MERDLEKIVFKLLYAASILVLCIFTFNGIWFLLMPDSMQYQEGIKIAIQAMLAGFGWFSICIYRDYKDL